MGRGRQECALRVWSGAIVPEEEKGETFVKAFEPPPLFFCTGMIVHWSWAEGIRSNEANRLYVQVYGARGRRSVYFLWGHLS